MTCGCDILNGPVSWPEETWDWGGWSDLEKIHSDSTSVPASSLTSHLITTLSLSECADMHASKHTRALAHPPKNIHMHTLSAQFFMEIDYVGQPPLLCTAVTLTHGNRGDSFPHAIGSGFILGPGVSWSRSARHPLFRWVKVWEFYWVCMHVFNILLTLF